MNEQLAYAIVTRQGKLALFDGRCPIFWHRKVAQEDCDRRFRGNRKPNTTPAFYVVRVTVSEYAR